LSYLLPPQTSYLILLHQTPWIPQIQMHQNGMIPHCPPAICRSSQSAP
jgi:hypothetical protein